MSPDSVARSSLEKMLDSLQRSDENGKLNHMPPILPARPKLTSRARLPSPKRRLPTSSDIGGSNTAPSSSNFTEKRVESRVSKISEREETPNSSNGDLKEENSESSRQNGFGFIRVKEGGSRESPDVTAAFDRKGQKRQLEERDDVNEAKSPPPSPPRSWEPKGFDKMEYIIQKKLRVWCWVHNSFWESGQVQSTSGEKASVLLMDGRVVTVSTQELLLANPDILDGVDNLVQLSYLNEPSILHNLQHRYFQDLIYSKAGPLLLAVNPFKDVQLYGNDFATAYRKKLIDSPHVYVVADAAYTKMMTDKVNQSIIVSGESGAGKTETAKIAMQYFVLVGASGGIESEMLQTSCCILEAFGSAKTARNDNSSRFGKLIEIHFSAIGEICSAEIRTFLLEKSRVVHLAQGERSYHIFYQLCAGAPSDLRDRLRLKRARDYYYLNQSNCLEIPGVGDAKKFRMLMGALDTLKISKEDQVNVLGILAAVLWLGNISYVVDNENHIEVVNDEAVANAAALIGCGTQELILVLSMHSIVAGKDKVPQKLSLQQAIDRRDSLSKFIYGSLFDWLVEKINLFLGTGKHHIWRSISILDMFGFESFKKNRFEQLCINYANEKLQQHIKRQLITLPQEDYDFDGINWTRIDFEDNQDCLDLFEKKPDGLISLLDEELKFPKATDSTLTVKLKQQLNSNRCFKGEQGGAFRVRHYSGEVVYDMEGFLLKNRDSLHSESIQLLRLCTNKLLQLFVSKLNESQELKNTSVACANQKQTIASKFKDQLFKLMLQLESTNPHFIHCIRPNTKKIPGAFEKDLVLQQLRCCGAVEAVKISKYGYPIRMTHSEFARKYGLLLPENNECHDPLSTSIAILQKLNIFPEMYQIGFTKLYFRPGQINALERIREQVLQGSSEVQKCFHAHCAHRNFHELKGGIVTLQSSIRGWLARRQYSHLQQSKQSNASEWKPGNRMSETKVQQDASPEILSLIEELRKQVSLAEVALGSKEKENAALREQVQQFEARQSKFESKMKSTEEMWQKEVASLQLSLDAATTTLGCDHPDQTDKVHGTLASFFFDSEDMALAPQTPGSILPARIRNNSNDEAAGGDSNASLNNVDSLVMEFEQRKQNFEEEVKAIVELKSEQAPSAKVVEELLRLKHRFQTWKKDFKVRLRAERTKALRVGHPGKHSWKWWGKRSKRLTSI